MIARGIELLRRARLEGWAIPAFSVYNLEQTLGVCRAADEARAPALLQAGSSAFGYAGLAPLAEVAIAAAEESPAELGVHLDHATELAEIRSCLERGYSSVMYDGSALPLDENIHRTRAVVREAARHGAWVEGELAGLAGDEDVSAHASSQALTDPEAADRFVTETGVEALAVAIGNVHGVPTTPVRLDLDRLHAISDRVAVPFVLHGASGLPDEELRAAVDLGVAKVNVNTELRRAFRDALLAIAADPPAGDALAPLLQPAIDAVRRVAAAKLRALGPAPSLRAEEVLR